MRRGSCLPGLVAIGLTVGGIVAYFQVAPPTRVATPGAATWQTPTPAATSSTYAGATAATAAPGTWSAGDCSWALGTLEQDARNDLANRPPGSDSAYYDAAAAKWLELSNLLRLTVCPRRPGAGPVPDASWYAGRQLSPAGCAWARSGLEVGLRSHTDHQAAVDSGRLAPPWPNETVADSDAWDRTWAGNYKRLIALLHGACAQ